MQNGENDEASPGITKTDGCCAEKVGQCTCEGISGRRHGKNHYDRKVKVKAVKVDPSLLVPRMEKFWRIF